MKTRSIASLAPALWLVAHSLSTGATLVPSLADAQINSDGTQNNTDFQSRIGEYYFPGGASLVLPFLLPTLAPGEIFGTANLRYQLYGIAPVPPTVGVDLYGLGRRASDTVLPGDYYSGTLDLTATLIQADLLTPGSPLGIYDTDSSTDSALVSYLNAQYANGAGAGQYVFLRFSFAGIYPDSDTGYSILTQNAGGETERPEFTYTTTAVPEPASGVLLAAAAGLAIARRRRVSRSL